MMNTPVRLASASLAGCFGCHMSLLDMDERLLDLIKDITLDRTPLTDIKAMAACDLGFIEGGVANAENVQVLQLFRSKCRFLVAVGACAITGGVPAMRNQFELRECLEESYFKGMGVENPMIPNDPEIPLLLDKVHPLHEVVKIDYFLPGCPPSAEAIWTFLSSFIADKPIVLPYTQLHYD